VAPRAATSVILVHEVTGSGIFGLKFRPQGECDGQRSAIYRGVPGKGGQ
jgi:hypothetical protein